MSTQDLKIYTSQFITFGFASITGIEMGLKIILLLASIVYTAQRIWMNHKERQQNKK